MRRAGATSSVPNRRTRTSSEGAVPVMLDGDGRPVKRNFVHVEDLVDAILAALDHPAARSQTFNICMDGPVDCGGTRRLPRPVSRVADGRDPHAVPLDLARQREGEVPARLASTLRPRAAGGRSMELRARARRAACRLVSGVISRARRHPTSANSSPRQTSTTARRIPSAGGRRRGTARFEPAHESRMGDRPAWAARAHQAPTATSRAARGNTEGNTSPDTCVHAGSLFLRRFFRFAGLPWSGADPALALGSSLPRTYTRA